MQPFFGIMYMRRSYGLKNQEISTFFSDKQGHPLFSATMYRIRFKFILADVAFDDLSDRQMCWKEDLFAAKRYVFEECNKNFANAMVPDFFLSVDKTLYPMHNKISFR